MILLEAFMQGESGAGDLLGGMEKKEEQKAPFRPASHQREPEPRHEDLEPLMKQPEPKEEIKSTPASNMAKASQMIEEVQKEDKAGYTASVVSPAKKEEKK